MYIEKVAQQVASHLSPDQIPDQGDVDRLMRGYAVLALTKGVDVTAEDVHDAWAAWMIDVDPAHPALRPYRELDRETQDEDSPYLAAVRAVATSLER
jgi:hypothetical protein